MEYPFLPLKPIGLVEFFQKNRKIGGFQYAPLKKFLELSIFESRLSDKEVTG
jgi:hypothetical protein